MEENAVVEKTFNEKREEFLALISVIDNPRVMVLAEELLKKAKKGQRGPKEDSKQTLFRKALLEAEDNQISEDEAWLKFKFGRHEALTACRNLHTRVAEGEDPIYAQDVVVDGVTYYKILGIGEMPPEYKIRRKRKGKGSEEVTEEVTEEVSEDFANEIDLGIDIH